MKYIKDFKFNSNIKEKTPKSGKIKLRIVILFSFIIMSLVFAQLVFSSNLSIDGQKLSQIDAELAILEAENNNLRVEIAKESSFTNLVKIAQDSDFSKPSEVINSI